ADGRLLAPGRAGAGGAAAVDACLGNANDRDLPVDVERLPVAADRDHLDQPEHGAAGAGAVPGCAPDELDAADGGQRHGAGADAAGVHHRPALVRAVAGIDRFEVAHPAVVQPTAVT